MYVYISHPEEQDPRDPIAKLPLVKPFNQLFGHFQRRIHESAMREQEVFNVGRVRSRVFVYQLTQKTIWGATNYLRPPRDDTR